MNQPNDQVDLGSTPRNTESQLPEAEEHDWWPAENELGRKQFRSRVLQGTYGEGPDRPKKRGKAHNRRGQNDHADPN